MPGSLDGLPFELLAQIASHLEHAQSLRNLSLVCKGIHQFTTDEGFRAFVQHRFPSIQPPPCWKDAAHALTTLSRAWDRKALVARYIETDSAVTVLQDYRKKINSRTRSRRQTMGYQPVIDSYDEWSGPDWTSRTEVLAWGAGASFYLRVKRMGRTTGPDDRGIYDYSFDQHAHRAKLLLCRDWSYADGRDDIVSLSLLRPSQKTRDTHEQVIVGRASGTLDRVSIIPKDRRNMITNRYATSGRAVNAASVSSGREPLLAAAFAGGVVGLYPVHSDVKAVNPHDEISVVPENLGGKIWSTKFLRSDRLAIGLGPSTEPLSVYDISSNGISHEPIRKFSTSTQQQQVSTSVYTTAPLHPSSQAGGAPGDVFLSGWYSGTVRMHDMRSPSQCESTFHDSFDQSAVYSLLPLGRERFVVGSAKHAIMKVFDLRMPGGKSYFATDLDTCTSFPHQDSLKRPYVDPEEHSACCVPHYRFRHSPVPWNVFLNIRPDRHRETPVYSLSSPSNYSPTIFAGVESRVLQLDVVEIMNKHPDPIFAAEMPQKSSGTPRNPIKAKWDPHNDVTDLALYSHSSEPGSGSHFLWHQRPIDAMPKTHRGLEGLDARLEPA